MLHYGSRRHDAAGSQVRGAIALYQEYWGQRGSLVVNKEE